MKRFKLDKKGVSPIVGTLLMIAVTVSLSGTVYLMAGDYMNMAQGGPEIISIKVSIYTKGIKETASDGAPNGHTYSGLRIEILQKSIQWKDYKVLINSEIVFTVPSDYIPVGIIPDANDEPSPQNTGRTFAGEEQWFSEESYRDDLLPLAQGKYYNVRLVNIRTNSLVWMADIMAR